MVIAPTFGIHGASRPTGAREFDTTGADRQREQTKRVTQSFARRIMRRVMRNRAARLARKMASRGLSKGFGSAGKGLSKAVGKANVYGFLALATTRLATGRSIENLEYLANPWNHAHRERAAKAIREQMMTDPMVARAVGIRAMRGEKDGTVEEVYGKLLDMDERVERGRFNILSEREFQSNGPLDLFILANREAILAAWKAANAESTVDQIIRKVKELVGTAGGGR